MASSDVSVSSSKRVCDSEETDEVQEGADLSSPAKEKRSPVWLMFSQDREAGWCCRACDALNREVKAIKQSPNATSNLLLHFKDVRSTKTLNGPKRLKNPDCAALFERLKLAITAAKEKNDKTFDASTWLLQELEALRATAPARKVQTAVTRFTSADWPARRAQVLLEMWMTRFAISENSVDHFLFGMFVDSVAQLLKPSSHIQSRRTRSDVIVESMFQSVELEIERHLSALEDIILSITSDSWTSQASLHKYVSITLHFLDERFLFQSLLWGIYEFDKPHTADNLEILWKEATNVGILKDAVLFSCVTDNGANFAKASRQLVNEDNALCAAHTLQLAVGDVMVTHWVDEVEVIPDFVLRVRQGVDLRSALAQAQPGDSKLELTLEVCTRWGSRYQMLCRFHKLREAVKTLAKTMKPKKDDTKDAQFFVAVQEESFWHTVETLIAALAPVNKLTELLGGENYVTMSSVPRRVAEIVKELRGFRHNVVAKDMAEAIEHRFAPWFRAGLATAAAVLDPQFANLAEFLPETNVDKKSPQQVIDETWQRLEKDFGYLCADMYERSFSDLGEEMFLGVGKRLLGKLRQIMEGLTPEERQSASLTTFWGPNGTARRLGNGMLVPLARAYLSVPATSVPSERVWSSAGFIYNDSNARLAAENVSKRVLIRDHILKLRNQQEVTEFLSKLKLDTYS